MTKWTRSSASSEADGGEKNIMSRAVATEPVESAAGTDLGGKYLTFFLDQEEYGIEILTVREIIGLIPVTTVPRTPVFVRGIINLRGKVIPVVDLRSKFAMDQVEDTEETCIIVVQTGGLQLGMVVDKVSEVLDIPGQEVVGAPSLGNEINTEFLLGIGKSEGRVTLLLNLDTVFPASELEAVASLG
jgi:purine-binding chemotaxis protein CheW